MRCRACGSEIPAGAGFCPGCGAPAKRKRKKGPVILITLFLLAICAGVGVGGWYGYRWVQARSQGDIVLEGEVGSLKGRKPVVGFLRALKKGEPQRAKKYLTDEAYTTLTYRLSGLTKREQKDYFRAVKRDTLHVSMKRKAGSGAVLLVKGVKTAPSEIELTREKGKWLVSF